MARDARRVSVSADLPELRGLRSSLSPVTDADFEAIEPWYREAVAAVAGVPVADAPGRETLQERLEGGGLLAVRCEDGAVVGVLDFRAGHPDAESLTIGFLALAAKERGFGRGSEAVRLLEEHAEKEWGARRLRADVDVRDGLGLYFWLRLGYRPADPTRDAQGREVQPMVREA